MHSAIHAFLLALVYRSPSEEMALDSKQEPSPQSPFPIGLPPYSNASGPMSWNFVQAAVGHIRVINSPLVAGTDMRC